MVETGGMEMSRDQNALISAAGQMNLGYPNGVDDFDGPKVKYVCGGKQKTK